MKEHAIGGREQEQLPLYKRLETISAISLTPMDPVTHAIDWDSVERNVEWLLSNGLKVIVPCGNTSEFYSLTLDEAKEEVTRVAKKAAGRAIIMPGIGYTVETAIELGKHAQEMGAECVMIHEPIQPFVTDRGALKYFSSIAEALDIPSIIYWKDPHVSDDVLAELCEMDQIVGVKYAINDLPRFAEIVRRVPKERHVTWICGTAEKWAPFFFCAGATGFTSGLVNVMADKSFQLLEALRKQDHETVWNIWNLLLPFENLRAKYNNGNNVTVIKEAVNLLSDRLGYRAGVVRPPAAPVDEQDAAEVKRILKTWNLL